MMGKGNQFYTSSRPSKHFLIDNATPLFENVGHYFFMRAKHSINHFEGLLEGTETFLHLKIIVARDFWGCFLPS